MFAKIWRTAKKNLRDEKAENDGIFAQILQRLQKRQKYMIPLGQFVARKTQICETNEPKMIVNLSQFSRRRENNKKNMIVFATIWRTANTNLQDEKAENDGIFAPILQRMQKRQKYMIPLGQFVARKTQICETNEPKMIVNLSQFSRRLENNKKNMIVFAHFG